VIISSVIRDTETNKQKTETNKQTHIKTTE